ncbi:hypothetical protein K9N68_03675 [Kovacikia minuta CCNUW1]|uniref:hypothetical protein n=1 Tax=Kovacikia minuta TaxID=2931930 RepID=UPI001CCECD07|nr:hypothetical protein [Kovacikia minuta]UBF27082.1 hypothetical protein K9N68_03675 [Kovacikia minuta CCNUW1]
MGKRIIVENDKVEGTDKHNVKGDATNPSAPPPSVPNSVWVAEYDYKGKITEQLSDFVRISGKPLAVKTSKSSLNPGEATAPAGSHSGPKGRNFIPLTPPPFPAKITDLKITDSVGEGKPSANAGSSFVKVGGVAVLLDGNKIDTCDGTSKPMNSTVTSENQDFVACSE